MTDTAPAPAGHNNPPAESFEERMEERHAKLLDEIAKLELARRHVPQIVNTDDDMAKVTAFVIRARELGRMAERTREAEKAPYLERGKAIDSFFGSLKTMLAEGAATIERRNTAYLQAKRVAEEAARQAAARKAQEEATAARKAADEALAAEQAARARQAEEEERLRAAANPQPDTPLADNVVPLVPAGAGETALRRATEAAQSATAATSAALEAAASASATANAAAESAASSKLGRSVGGGGAARLNTEWTHRVTDAGALRASLGWLADFLPDRELQSALERACKAKPRPPTIPGVTFTEEAAVKTTALRPKKEST